MPLLAFGPFFCPRCPAPAWESAVSAARDHAFDPLRALSGAEDFVETRLWGLKKLRFLRGMLPFKRGIPSHDMRVSHDGERAFRAMAGSDFTGTRAGLVGKEGIELHS